MIASTYSRDSFKNISAVMILPLIYLTGIPLNTRFSNSYTAPINSGLNAFQSSSSILANLLSSYIGLTMQMQSLTLKYSLIFLLMRFFLSPSGPRFCESYKAYSKYSLEVRPRKSSEKSLSTHRNVGKNWLKLLSSDPTLIVSLSLITSDRFSIDYSSIWPN